MVHEEMNHDIAVGSVVSGNRRGDAEHGAREGTEVGADHIRAASGCRRVKVRDDAPVPAVGGVKDDVAVSVHNPDFRPQVSCDGLELGVGALERERFAVVDARIGCGNEARLVVERLRAALD